jgi:nucleoid-associated protein YgaU
MSAFQTEVSRLERFFSEEGETGDGQQENPIRFGNLEGIKGQFDEAMLGLNVLAEERDAFSLQAEMATRAALEAVDQVAAVEESLLKATDDRDTHLFQLNQLENRNESLTERLERTAYELDVAEKLASDLTSQYATLLQETAELDEIGDAQQSQLRTTRNSLEQAQNEVARLTGARGIYTVQPADSLSSIARFFYRNGNRWSDIAMANRFLIGGNPDLIYPGMVLVVPH